MKEEKNQEKRPVEARGCGVYTCIHCVVSTCTLDECEMYENRFMQEG